MTALLVANLIAAIAVVGGLTAACLLGFQAGGGRFDRRVRRLELHRSVPARDAAERRAA
jgi:hypothetical protein